MYKIFATNCTKKKDMRFRSKTTPLSVSKLSFSRKSQAIKESKLKIVDAMFHICHSRCVGSVRKRIQLGGCNEGVKWFYLT